MTKRYLFPEDYSDYETNYFWLVKEHKGTWKTTDRYYLYGNYNQVLSHLWGITYYDNLDKFISIRHQRNHNDIAVLSIDGYKIEAIKKPKLKQINKNCYDISKGTDLQYMITEFKYNGIMPI